MGWENGKFLWQGALRILMQVVERCSVQQACNTIWKTDMEIPCKTQEIWSTNGFPPSMSIKWRVQSGDLMIWIPSILGWECFIILQEAGWSNEPRMETIQAIRSFGGSCAWSITTTLMLAIDMDIMDTVQPCHILGMAVVKIRCRGSSLTAHFQLRSGMIIWKTAGRLACEIRIRRVFQRKCWPMLGLLKNSIPKFSCFFSWYPLVI